MTCQDFEELSGAYVLGSLSAEEKKAVEEHLAQCPTCPARFRELQAIVNLLPLSVPDVEPAADLKGRFFARLQQEQPNNPSHRDTVVPLHQSRPAARRAAGRTWRAALIAVAAVLLFSALGAMTLWNLSLQRQVASLSANVVQTTSYKLQGTASEAAAQGQLTCYTKQQICVAVMHGLSPTAGNHVYQGWLLQGKQPTSVGLFTLHDGTATLPFQGTTTGYDAVAISLEPGPAASQHAPKGPVIALGALQNATSS
ncbi:anti-sigma factor [Dictyobacter kobayashii]|uniref:Regulator of SigK n=1 Tax=Dictyobacter kobayashii TaxID=2014872 RepID=A0A402AKJ9_9CHLR|nr:anti-sigma factor [Dictyobacter kobayashii]GCE19758.1 hypothetical protein KDK_35580 [Dictyobacter kobayashii]